MSLSRKWDFGLYAYKFDKWDVWTCPLMRNMICEPIWFLYSVKWKYWNDFFSKVFGFVFGIMKVLEWLCRENEILVYMPTRLINGKFELVPWCETRYVNLFGFVFGKIKVLEWLCRENEILVYMPTSLINEMFELFPWYKKLYVNLLCFVFNKMKVLEWPLSRKWDYSIYD